MHEFPSPAEVLRVFEQNPAKTCRLRELVVELGLRSSQARDLKHVLKDLSRQRKVLISKKNHYAWLGPSRSRQGLASPSRPPHPALRHGDEGIVKSYAGQDAGDLAALRNVVSGRLIGHRDG